MCDAMRTANAIDDTKPSCGCVAVSMNDPGPLPAVGEPTEDYGDAVCPKARCARWTRSRVYARSSLPRLQVVRLPRHAWRPRFFH